jgi:hypothetical protein
MEESPVILYTYWYCIQDNLQGASKAQSRLSLRIHNNNNNNNNNNKCRRPAGSISLMLTSRQRS